MSLSPELRARLRKAIESAFHNYDELRIAIGEGNWTGLHNVRLEEFVKPDPLRIVVFNLVEWAEKNGRVRNLYEICQLSNPGNALLSQLAEDIRGLTEEPAIDITEKVAIHTETYTIPTRPLTPQQRTLLWANPALFGGQVLAFALWTCIFISQAWMFWLATVVLGLLSRIWDMFADLPLAWRVLSTLRDVLIRRSVLIVLLVTAAVGLVASLFISRVEYDARQEEPSIMIAGDKLQPGERKWVPSWPTGRKLQADRMGDGYQARPVIVYPWRLAKITSRVIPYVVIEPHPDILENIGTTEDNPAQQWQLTVKHNNQVIYENPNYRGNALVLGADEEHTPKLPPAMFRRTPEYILAALEPADELHIQLASNPSAASQSKFVTIAVVKTPSDPESPAQSILVPAKVP
jgi:hypothetical protein